MGTDKMKKTGMLSKPLWVNLSITVRKDGLRFQCKFLRPTKQVRFDDIVAVTRWDAAPLRQLGHRLPMARLWLQGGKTATVPRFFNLWFDPPESDVESRKNLSNYDRLINIILEKLPKLKRRGLHWYHVRLLAPAAAAQLITLFCALKIFGLRERTMDNLLVSVLLGTLVGLIPGWIWDRRALRRRLRSLEQQASLMPNSSPR